MINSLGSDFFAGGALGVASSAIVVRGARRGIPRSTRQRGWIRSAKRHLSAERGQRTSSSVPNEQRSARARPHAPYSLAKTEVLAAAVRH